MATATRFASLQQRTNAAVLRHLANAQALLPDGHEVPVIFDTPYADAFDDQIDTAAPQCLGDSAALGALRRDDALLIDGRPYRVQRAEPDGTGLTRLLLYAPQQEVALP